MPYILKQNNAVILKTKTWSPNEYSQFTQTSYPKNADTTYIWEQDDYWLGWEEEVLTQEEINAINEQLRADAYRNESDPLFFKAQRNEATMEEWIAKVTEIKTRYPKD